MITMLHATQIHGESSQREREYLAGWQRARADLDNYRRRVLAEHAVANASVRRQAAEPLLTLADILRAAAAALPADLAKNNWALGVLQIARQLDAILADLGLTIIGEAGTKFDPQHHEAISAEPSADHAPGTIIAVHQPGYRIGEHIIRPAKVTVARETNS
ncbi:MAG: nucleotide exchange factor GrpE [Candidatus Andersenbacteria bacterium]|nr:nucleotide exchange factor GrpE [Candidatus Andersenbacteria bacterium]